jgi:hypothetical protein
VISVENKKLSAVIDMLVERKYDSDPEKAWRDEAKKRVRISKENLQASILNSFSMRLNFQHMLFMKIRIN